MSTDDGPGYYEHLSFNAPLSDRRAGRIVSRLAASAPSVVLDVGCGWGELLLRVLEACPAATGVGVDTDGRALERARANAARRGLDDRVELLQADAGDASGTADVVLCIGSSHAFGDTAQALSALRERVRPGGRLVLGEGTWNTPAADADLSLVPDDLPRLADLAGLVELAVGAGYRPLFVETASVEEWDTFESGYLADWEEWLVAHPGHPDADRIRQRADDHRTRWLRGYRTGLGFAYLTLGLPTQ
ncbi:MAG TPA: class I SAM-dependent methyltransferase [Nocardioidaceae bacterium]|nr:class I SAM-dependent methyltransferase [Nocardioidaceae bacterium]